MVKRRSSGDRRANIETDTSFGRYSEEIQRTDDKERREALFRERERLLAKQKRKEATDFFDPQGARLQKLRKLSTTRRLKRELSRRKFAETRTGRLGRFVSRVPRQVGQGRLRVGRPRGTYDPRYRNFGGVYGFRKLQAAQLRAQRIQQIRENTLTPEQQQLLAQAQARQQARALDPEQQTIPDTNGRFDLRRIFQEIEEASNAVA